MGFEYLCNNSHQYSICYSGIRRNVIGDVIMKDLIFEIRKLLGVSQKEFAEMVGVSFATVNRWENGRSNPSRAVQLRIYEVCKENGVDLKEAIQKKIADAVSKIDCSEDSVILYHGSKSGINGPIAPISRIRCDFGGGFYMGTDPYQPLTLISDFEHSKFYVLRLRLNDLRVLTVDPDIEWAMLVAYNRGKMDSAKGTSLYEHYANMAAGYDVIRGSIANDRMFYVLDNFFLGNITDKALIKSLSALQLGQQYVAVTEKACNRVVVEAEIELSYLERVYLRDLSEANRVKGVNLANQICKDFRREGLFFDEILEKAVEGGNGDCG